MAFEHVAAINWDTAVYSIPIRLDARKHCHVGLDGTEIVHEGDVCPMAN